MGIIKAAINSVAGAAADQWIEVIEPDEMSDMTVMTKGVMVRRDDKRNNNTKSTVDVITDGSVVHVYPNMMMLLVDGGKIIDYTAEEGYYTVKNDLAPSMLNGSLKEAVGEAFNRFKFGGVSPQKQQVFFINLQEIKGIKFGTQSPLQYFDNFYNAELFLRAHGTYSVKITDPISFYVNAIPKNKSQVEISDINEQYLQEFLTALNTSINQYSAQGERVSHIPSKSMELSKFMSNVLDEDWKNLRGLEIVSVAVASISYTDESQQLINMRNQGAMLQDATIREGYVQGAVAKGIQDAGSNPAGSGNAFMGINMGMNTAGGFMQSASETNRSQMSQQSQQTNTPESWTCPKCNSQNTGKFCSNCGEGRTITTSVKIQMACSECGGVIDLSNGVPKFCPECGKPFIAKPL
ncbi:Membrane protease subunit, stomatin/prohibitin family, contains C-terminal Zn-ribbon domain [Pilibacter termitis]|uniref:Membrane protease subunit, stomatin/prohibitin family, contains C-terminal Zn-ribbon domain n=1 Tax=Pilibacter termitis TaxID=263852 RepID=A0A1T4LVY9_9ENTE|nr:SPFH domain-containing protein [Pilibacter termitis]SJZ58903.1 Membrane protease subunit, stomatin/prohibitin family, contains C-terminal Zn-ribbon domain [Pilibacter termitis]